jgi:hypothetical protein
MHSHAVSQALKHFAQGGTGPMDTMVFFQQFEDVMLRVIRTPATHSLGQSRGGQTRFDPQAQLQGMNGTPASLKRFIESPPYLYGPKERRHRARVLAATPIEMPFKLDPSRGLLIVFRLEAIQSPGHDASSYFAQQRTEFPFKSHRLLGRGVILEKLINEANPTRQ